MQIYNDSTQLPNWQAWPFCNDDDDDDDDDVDNKYDDDDDDDFNHVNNDDDDDTNQLCELLEWLLNCRLPHFCFDWIATTYAKKNA